MYSAASAVILAAFCVLLLVDVIVTPSPEFGFTASTVLVIGGIVAAVGILFLGDRAGPWPALLILAAHVVPAILFLTVLESPRSALSVVLQMPVIALYLGGFLVPWLARATQLIVMITFASVVVADPNDVVEQLNSGRHLPSVLVFTWLCLEAGIFVQKRFKHETRIDPLTGLTNRRGFIELAEIERARADRNGEQLCLAIVDLDEFKRVNDTLGHNAGDKILRDLAQQWRLGARRSDVICRLGGDEFVFLLPDTALAGGRLFMMRLSEGATHPWSWGVAEWHAGEAVASAISRADSAMYDHKLSASKRARPTQVAT